MKKCNNCGIEKELTEFNKDKARPDGLRNACRICYNAKMRAYKEKLYGKSSGKNWRDIAKENKDNYEKRK